MMSDINIDKNVYLLGAGFSKEIGLPLQDEFLLIAQEVFFKNPKLFKHFERVFEYRDKLTRMKKYLSYPLLNLEQLFNLIEMDIFYSNDESIENVKRDFIKLVCDVIIDKTPNPFINNESGRLQNNPIYDLYIYFIKLLINNDKYKLKLYNDTIISFNYDLVLEGAVSVYNWKRSNQAKHSDRVADNFIRFNTLFGKGNIIIDHVSNYFIKNRPNSYFPEANLFSTSNNAIKLIKLHGSINWKNTDDKSIFIVPPTWNKSDARIRLLWYEAYKELIGAKRIIFIGYSFPETDIYVRSLLGLALNENSILQNIYFINPDKEIAKKICLSLLDKYFEKYCAYVEMKFSDFIFHGQSIMEKINRSKSP